MSYPLALFFDSAILVLVRFTTGSKSSSVARCFHTPKGLAKALYATRGLLLSTTLSETFLSGDEVKLSQYI
jgi:predicted metallopeptidase